eukprot:3429774-Pyramimonas_sp.AAC.1
MIALRARGGKRATLPRRRRMAWGTFSKALFRSHSRMRWAISSPAAPSALAVARRAQSVTLIARGARVEDAPLV